MRISDWSSDVCSSDLAAQIAAPGYAGGDGGFQTALGGRRAADLPHQAAKGDDRIYDGLADRYGALAGAVLIGLLPHGEIGAEHPVKLLARGLVRLAASPRRAPIGVFARPPEPHGTLVLVHAD